MPHWLVCHYGKVTELLVPGIGSGEYTTTSVSYFFVLDVNSYWFKMNVCAGCHTKHQVFRDQMHSINVGYNANNALRFSLPINPSTNLLRSAFKFATLPQAHQDRPSRIG
jgi:hypothetical protein